MLSLVDPVDQMAAVLHDALEDTDLELHDLTEARVPNDARRCDRQTDAPPQRVV
jgi:hypothetical protein